MTVNWYKTENKYGGGFRDSTYGTFQGRRRRPGRATPIRPTKIAVFTVHYLSMSRVRVSTPRTDRDCIFIMCATAVPLSRPIFETPAGNTDTDLNRTGLGAYVFKYHVQRRRSRNYRNSLNITRRAERVARTRPIYGQLVRLRASASIVR